MECTTQFPAWIIERNLIYGGDNALQMTGTSVYGSPYKMSQYDMVDGISSLYTGDI